MSAVATQLVMEQVSAGGGVVAFAKGTPTEDLYGSQTRISSTESRLLDVDTTTASWPHRKRYRITAGTTGANTDLNQGNRKS